MSNVEVTPCAAAPDELLVRSNFVVHDVRPGYQAMFPGWDRASARGRAETEWLIAVKQVNLLDSDQAHANLSIIF